MPLFPRYDGPPLLERICSVENLTLAWRRVRSNIRLAWRNRSAGLDAVTIRDFEADWARQMTQLAEELSSGAYRPLPPRRVAIPKRSGGERAISILAVRDRVAQRAVQQVLEPLFDPLFLDCSYGCRPHVGVPEAITHVTRYAAQGLTWAVDADIASYFDQIDHRILLALVRQRVDEAPLLRLLARWLEVGALHTSETAPINACPPTLLARGSEAIRRVLAWGTSHVPPLPPDPHGPYAAAMWEQPTSSTDGTGESWMPLAPGLEQRLWTWLVLARPVASGVQLAWPYVRRLGGHRLAMAGAGAAIVLAASEALARSHVLALRGTAQGGALSPLLANIYLHPFDVALTSQGLRLVRFMDDFVIMCASQAEAEQALQLAQRQLASLRLTLNPEKTRVVSYADGLEFLGQALVPRQRGPRLEQGLKSFEEAQAALRKAAGTVRRRLKR
jgi:RNA-directed DNA polymerase